MSLPILMGVKQLYLLLAENNYISSREIKTLLVKNGLEYEVLKCSSSDALLDIAGKLMPDIIIIDFDLCLNRSEIFIREIRMLSPKAYILAFVSADHFEKISGAIETGIDDYMIKPLRREDIIMRLMLGLQRRAVQSEQPDFTAEEKKEEEKDRWEKAFNRKPDEKEEKRSFIFYNRSKKSSEKRKNDGDAELINFVDLLHKSERDEIVSPVAEEQVIEDFGEEKDSAIFSDEKIDDQKDETFIDDLTPDLNGESLPWPDEERAYFENEEEHMESDKMVDDDKPDKELEQDKGSSFQDWMKEPEFSSVVEEKVEVAVNNYCPPAETAKEVDEPGFSSKNQVDEDEDDVLFEEENVPLTDKIEKSEELLQEMELPEQWEQAEDSNTPVENEVPLKEVEERKTENQEKHETVKIDDSELFGVQSDGSRPDKSEFEELFGAGEPDYKEQKKEVYAEDFFNDQVSINTDQGQPGKAAAEEKPADQGKNKIIGSILTASFLITLLTISVLLVYT